MTRKSEQQFNKMLLWHQKVHEHFNENLYYFVLRFKGYQRQYRDNIQEASISQGIVGICIYEVFGDFDILIRVWLTPSMLLAFTKILDSIASLSYYQVMNVKRISHWGFMTEPKLEFLYNATGDLDLDVVQRDIREGNYNSIKAYADAHLAIIREKENENGVKFYSALHFGESGVITKRQEDEIYKSLIEIQEEILNKKSDEIPLIQNLSFYFGDGFAHVLAKGNTSNFVVARKFVVEQIIRRLRTLLPEVTTYAICDEEPYESDDVSRDALETFHQGTPPIWITNWFPDFFKLGGDPKIVTKVHSLLANYEIIIRNLPNDYLINLLNPLLESVITENPDKAVKEVLYWFSTVESRLYDNNNWFSFLRRLSGCQGEEVSIISKQIEARVGTKQPPTFVDLLNKYCWALKEYRPDSPLLGNKTPTSDLSDMRNIFAHGQIFIKFNEIWERLFNLLMWFLPLYTGINIISKLKCEDTEN